VTPLRQIGASDSAPGEGGGADLALDPAAGRASGRPKAVSVDGRVLPAPRDGCEAVAAPDAEWVLMYRLGLSRQRIPALVRVPPGASLSVPKAPIFRARVVNVPQVTPLSIRCCDAHERAPCPPLGTSRSLSVPTPTLNTCGQVVSVVCGVAFERLALRRRNKICTGFT
jgi:hypothetical protein